MPRPIWIELGQRLDYNYIQSQFELEFRDYVEEVEGLERELQGVEQLSDPCKRRVAESKVRQATISRIEDIGLIEEITRSKGLDLIPLAEDRVANNKLHNITERAWLTYSADGLVPFLYSNSYIEGGRRLIFKHQDPREL